MVERVWNGLKKRHPLVYLLTNFVTANDCANILLAAGASPLMSLDERESAELGKSASAVVINFGTPSESAVRAMLAAGKSANAANVPVLLDPVGVGATTLRNDIARELLEQIQFAAIRGNASEIRALCGKMFDGQGVDAGCSELSDSIENAALLARQWKTTVGVSGAVDVVSDGKRTVLVHNGNERMPQVTGSGCMLSALCGACLGGSPEHPFAALLGGFVAMGIAGELAAERLQSYEGNAAFRNRMIDAVSLLDVEDLKTRGQYESI